MKKYKITVTDSVTKKTVLEIEEMTITKKYLQVKYAAKFRFNQPPVKITFTRLVRKPGIQLIIPM